MRVLRRHELAKLVPYHINYIYRMEKAGRFPRRVQIGPNRVAWIESEVVAWLNERIAERDAEPVKAA